MISHIDSKAFGGITSIVFITLKNNQLTLSGSAGNSALFEDYKIALPVGSPFQQLKQLVTLNLVNNSITSLFEDYTLESLKNLNMSYNHISVVSYDEFQSLARDDVVIDLTNNRIEEVNFPSTFDPQTPSFTVHLNNNPIECDCNILHFVKYLTQRNSTETVNKFKIKVGDLKCEKPENLRNDLVASLNPMQLLCQLDSEETLMKRCPSDCECQVRLEDRHLLMNCAANVNFATFPNASQINLKNTELRIEDDNLTALPSTQSAGGYREVTKLLVSHNQLTEVGVENLPANLTLLQLHDNKLESLNMTVMNFIRNSSISRLTLSGNPWKCDCLNLEFMNFVQQLHSKIYDYSEMKCDDGRSFNTLKPGDLCTDDNLFIVIISLITAFMGLVLGGLAALYYKYQKQIKMWLYSHNMCLWFVTEEELDKVCLLINHCLW